MEILDVVVDMAATLIESIIYVAVLNAYWKYKGAHKWKLSIAAVFLLFITGFCLSDYFVLQLVLAVLIMIGYSRVLVKADILQAGTISMFLMANTGLVNLATILSVEVLSWICRTAIVIDTAASKLAYVAFNRILFIITFYIYGRLLAKRRIIKKEEWMLLSVYFFSDSIIAVTLIVWTYTRYFDRQDYIYMLIIEAMVIVMTVVSFAIANHINNVNEREKESKFVNLRLQAQQSDIIRMDKEYQDIMKIRHDLVKHLNIYMHLLNDGDYEKLRKAIGQYIEDCGQNKYIYVNGNNLVNSVINEKKEVCQRENIKFNVEVTATADEDDELDTAVMLSNLLDNAIEAQKKIQDKNNCMIMLKIFSYENKYSLIIKNTIAQSVLQSNPELRTDKHDKYIHGIGMKSIEQTVQKRGGYIQKYEEKGLFCIHILL